MEKPFCPTCEREYPAGSRFCLDDGTELILRSEDTMSGEVFDGRYRILHKLGEGGMGAVYKAQQISTGKPVAIKVISKNLTDNPATVKRFQREATLQSKLEHPNIVTVIDFARTPDGQYFFVMPFVEGKSLRRMILDHGALSVEDFIPFATQTLDGLDYAHGQSVIHRDLKGDNIIIAQMGRQRVVKILDFGLAKAVQGEKSAPSDSELTQQGRVLGTPAYMSPEQARGDIDNIGPGSDIYSLGVIFYQMLTGELPFKSDTPWGLMHKHISETPRPLREANPSVPEGVERVIMRCLEKEPERRYPSALAVKQDLERAAHTIVGAQHAVPLQESEAHTTVGADPRVRPKKGRHIGLPLQKSVRQKAMAAVLLVLLLAAGGLAWLYFQPPGNEGERVAMKKAERMSGANIEKTRKAEEAKRTENERKRQVELEKKKRAEEAVHKTEREKIESLLAGAESDLKVNRLTSPAGANAMEKFKRVMEMEPENEQAKTGMKMVAIKYVEMAEGSASNKEFEKAKSYLEKADAILPGLAELLKAREDLVAAIKAVERERERLAGLDRKRKEEDARKAKEAKKTEEERQRNEANEQKRKHELAAGYIELAESHLTRRRLGKAEEFIAKAEALFPSSPEAKRLRDKLKKRKRAPEGMVFVKGGCFDMGDTFGGGDSDERPVHRVCVDDFFMDKFEVTRAQFKQVMGKKQHWFRSCQTCPADDTDEWSDARDYCEKTGKRLAAEAEWEYAAREGGKKIKYGTGKNEIDKNEARGKFSFIATNVKPVGSYPPNALGLYDMAGNVWEWVADWYDENYYNRSPEKNPTGPASGKKHVARGGSWAHGASKMRASNRNRGEPRLPIGIGRGYIGFRCVQ